MRYPNNREILYDGYGKKIVFTVQFNGFWVKMVQYSEMFKRLHICKGLSYCSIIAGPNVGLLGDHKVKYTKKGTENN